MAEKTTAVEPTTAPATVRSTASVNVPARKGLFNHKPHSVTVSYGDDTLVVPPRGRIQKVDISLLPKELPDGLVVYSI